MGSTEQSTRARVVSWGVGVTVVMALASAMYAFATPEAANRTTILAVAVFAILDAQVIWRFRRVLVGMRRYVTAMAVWNAAHILCAAWMCVLDGGIGSPFTGIFFLSVAFAAVSLPTRALCAIGLLDVCAVVGVTLVHGAGPAGLSSTALWTVGLLVTGGVCAAIAEDREQRLHAVRAAKMEMLDRLARVIEFRDTDTGDHIGRMSEYAGLIAERMGHPADRDDFRAASTMHDIGKVAVPDAILLKPGALTPDERSTMECHARLGYDMLAGSRTELLDLAAEIALTHHERWDGEGYPQRLAGTAIPLSGRIVAVADVFDALTSDRVYKRAMPVDKAVEIIRSSSGSQFDPQVVAVFLGLVEDILEVRRRSVLAELPSPAGGVAPCGPTVASPVEEPGVALVS